MMTYKGYSGVAEIDYDTAMIYGRVVGLRDIITFQGDTVAEAQQAFRDSVDDYLEFCDSRGEPPEKPFSGRFLVRIAPALHRSLVERALTQHVSLNALIEHVLAETVAEADSPRVVPRRAKAKEAPAPEFTTPAPKPKSRPRAAARPSR